jgi:hypothetical protein
MYPRDPVDVASIEPATPLKGADTRSIGFKTPFCPIENEFREPTVDVVAPRSRQYSTRLFESRVNHDGFSSQSGVFDVSVRLKACPYLSRDRVVMLPPESAANKMTALQQARPDAVAMATRWKCMV